MFDGNHRTRRTVNTGSTNRRQILCGLSTKKGQQSSRIGGIYVVDVISKNGSISNATLVLEETKRRRIKRRILQQQNIS